MLRYATLSIGAVPMAEPGGPTTQSGILYQNSIAVLYLGRMLDPVPRPQSECVVEVRVEAPTHVDDIVVSFQDGHVSYIQTKENIEPRGEVWEKLWKHFEAQLASPNFNRGRDRLVLHLGMIQPWHRSLSDLCKRAATSKTDLELDQRLSAPLRGMLEQISAALHSPAAPRAAPIASTCGCRDPFHNGSRPRRGAPLDARKLLRATAYSVRSPSW